jgi:glutathione S-transferase
VAATLYSLKLSHPGKAAGLMLERKGIEHRVVHLLPGLHPVLVRARGFRRNTVPALRIDGRRVQGSVAISRALEAIQPEPPLFPADPGLRAAVEAAEAWGDGDFQHAPRRALRWSAGHVRPFRRWIAEREGLPLPGVVAEANVPIARLLASRIGADAGGVQAMLRSLPGMLDHVDTLIADGVIGGAEPNAADFQLLTTVRTMLAMDDLRPFVTGRPCEPLARAMWADPLEPVPPALPRDWIQSALPSSAATA